LIETSIAIGGTIVTISRSARSSARWRASAIARITPAR
jgi:hypothetical protein